MKRVLSSLESEVIDRPHTALLLGVENEFAKHNPLRATTSASHHRPKSSLKDEDNDQEIKLKIQTPGLFLSSNNSFLSF